MYTLGHEVGVERALEELGVASDAPRFFHGTFVVTHDAVLCFFTLGAMRLETSRRVVWTQPQDVPRPASTPRDIAALRARFSEVWPAPVVEVYDRSVRPPVRIRQHRLFLRVSEGDPYVYVGAAHLASHRMGSATFELDERLSRTLWLRLGGYAGFRVELAHEHVLLDDGDVSAFETRLSELAGRERAHLVITRYEDDWLHVFTNRRCAFLMYLREPADSGLYVEPRVAESPAADETFRCDCGMKLVYPARCTVPCDEAVAIARAFFRTGALPQDRRWTERAP